MNVLKIFYGILQGHLRNYTYQKTATLLTGYAGWIAGIAGWIARYAGEVVGNIAYLFNSELFTSSYSSFNSIKRVLAKVKRIDMAPFSPPAASQNDARVPSEHANRYFICLLRKTTTTAGRHFCLFFCGNS